MRLYRLIAILLLVESRGQVKARELADALETSPRTIYRDVETLCQAGVPICATTGPNGGIRFMEGYSARLYNLRGEDAVNIYLSGAGMLGGGSATDLKSALIRLEQTLPAHYSADIRAARERFYFDDAPWWGDRPNVPCLEELRRAVWSLRKLRITYSKVNGGSSTRTVRPYGLVLKNMEWYLAAYAEDSCDIRTFKCERIVEAVLLDETFIIPEGFNLERHWHGSVSSFRSARRSEEQYAVKIKLNKRNAWVLEKLEVYDTKEEDGCIFADVNMHSFACAQTEALGIAWLVEIVLPAELRRHMAAKAADLAGLYG